MPRYLQNLQTKQIAISYFLQNGSVGRRHRVGREDRPGQAGGLDDAQPHRPQRPRERRAHAEGHRGQHQTGLTILILYRNRQKFESCRLRLFARDAVSRNLGAKL